MKKSFRTAICFEKDPDSNHYQIGKSYAVTGYNNGSHVIGTTPRGDIYDGVGLDTSQDFSIIEVFDKDGFIEARFIVAEWEE